MKKESTTLDFYEAPIAEDDQAASEAKWDLVIDASISPFRLNLFRIWRYRDLLMLLVHRDVVTVYKQTVLGPLWYIIQPILTSLVYVVIFGRVAGISTDGLPQMLFYLAGVTVWTYFADSLKLTSDIFKKNEQIFGKVYFPRVIVPLSIVISNLIKFGIQLGLFIGIYVYFIFRGANIVPKPELLLLPAIVLLMAMLGLGFGMIISAWTAKYRDLKFLVQFGVQLSMYATPVVYPISIIPDQYSLAIHLNPMTSIVESFKYMWLGQGDLSWLWLGYTSLFAIIVFFVGLGTFNRTEKNFMDVV